MKVFAVLAALICAASAVPVHWPRTAFTKAADMEKIGFAEGQAVDETADCTGENITGIYFFAFWNSPADSQRYFDTLGESFPDVNFLMLDASAESQFNKGLGMVNYHDIFFTNGDAVCGHVDLGAPGAGVLDESELVPPMGTDEDVENLANFANIVKVVGKVTGRSPVAGIRPIPPVPALPGIIKGHSIVAGQVMAVMWLIALGSTFGFAPLARTGSLVSSMVLAAYCAVVEHDVPTAIAVSLVTGVVYLITRPTPSSAM